MRNLKHTIPLRTLQLMYNGLVLPHLQYGILAWGSSTSPEFNRIIKLQKMALRTIGGKFTKAHHEPICKSLGLLKVRDLYEIACIKLIHKWRTNTLPAHLMSCFIYTQDYHQRDTRASESNLHVPRSKLEIRNKTFRIFAPLLYNSLPTEIKNKNISTPAFVRTNVNRILDAYSQKCPMINAAHCSICTYQHKANNPT